MTDEYLLGILRQLAHGLAVHFGDNCEVLIHDPGNLEQSIVHIENGHVSNRKLGDGPSPIVLEALQKDPASLTDQLSYLTRSKDGRALKSSTIYIRDRSGELGAIFSINFDITTFMAMESGLKSFLATGEDRPIQPEPVTIPINVNDLLEELIAQSIRLVGKPPVMMTRDEKVRAVKFLNDRGAFLITRSGDRVTEEFGISKYTLYSYIEAGKNI